MSHPPQLRALVVGCTGVSGSALVSQLITDSEKKSIWSEIVGLSRGPSTRLEVTKRSKKSSFVVRFIAADLTVDDAQILADQIGADLLARITHVFFCIWIPQPNHDEEFKINCKVLDNFLNSLVLVRKQASGASNPPSYPRLILVEGTKVYGDHIGPKKFADHRVPYDEDTYSRHPAPPANFYFGWEDIVKKRQWPEWLALRPGPIIGVSVQRSSYYNFGSGLGVFLTLLKSLDRPMIFPNPVDGSDKKTALSALRDSGDTKIVAAELAWMALLPSETLKSKEILDAYGSPAFNCSNGEPYRWGEIWPQLATRFGMKYSLEDSFDMIKFLNDPEVKAQWARLVEQHGLITSPNLAEVAVWPVVTATLAMPFDSYASLKKVRKFGFTKTTSNLEMYVSVIKELQENKAIPPILIS